MKARRMASIILGSLLLLVPAMAHGDLLVITPADFVPTTSNVGFWINQGAIVKTSMDSATFYAPVHLPHGAVINKVTICYIHVTPNVHLGISLVRKHLMSPMPTSGNTLVMLEHETTPNGITPQADTIGRSRIIKRRIDNSRFKYLFALDYPAGGSDLYLSGIKVDYTAP